MLTESGRYNARELLEIPIDTFANISGVSKYIVVCDDGEIETLHREMILTRFIWELYHNFPVYAIKTKHTFATKRGSFSGDTHKDLLGDIYFDSMKLCIEQGIIEVRGFDGLDELDYSLYPGVNHPDQFFELKNKGKFDLNQILPHLRFNRLIGMRSGAELIGKTFVVSSAICQHMYELSDMIFQFYRHKPEKVMSIGILDFVRLQKQPDIWQAMTVLHEKESKGLPIVSKDIQKVYVTIDKIIKSDKRQINTPLVMSANCKSLKIGQLYKCVGPYGFVTDVDNAMFPRCPIIESLTTGLTRIEYTIVESRTAAMSIFYQSDAMRKSEYLTRQLQLEGANIWRIHHGVDCGTKKYTEYHMPYNHLKDMVGTYYLDEESGTEKIIQASDVVKLGGRVLKLRTSLSCQLPDRYGICEKCYGTLAKSLMPGDNVGHFAATTMQEKITQKILSNKHLVGNAVVEKFRFGGTDSQYLTTKDDDAITAFFLNGRLKAFDSVQLIFDENDATKIQDISFINDLSATSPVKLSRLTGVKIQAFKDNVMVEDYFVSTHTESRKAYFTVNMLQYMKDRRWKFDHQGNYIVDLTQWDYDQPIMDMPLIQYSTPAHMMAVKKFFIGGDNSDSSSSLLTYHSPEAALSALHELVRSNVEVNFAHLHILLAAMLASDEYNLDYRVPKIKGDGKLANYNSTIKWRDSALAMAYEAHYLSFFSEPTAFLVPRRSVHPLNMLLKG